MKNNFKVFILISSIFFMSACGNGSSPSSDLTILGVNASLSDATPTQIPADQNIILNPSSSFSAKHMQVNDPSQLGVMMTVQVTVTPLQVADHFLSFVPDNAPDEPLIFSPYNFNFPREWRLVTTNTPGVFEAKLPAQNGVLTLHELLYVASPSDLVGTGETCDGACDDKLCCGNFRCWSLRISVCASEGSDPNACWSCLCEMSWGCLSHNHDGCKSSCNTCNENTWPNTQDHCIEKL